MKKLSAIFLLVLFAGIAGRYVLFSTYISTQKTEFRTSVINGQNPGILCLSLSNKALFKNENGFEWEENNDEVLINGDFYEVIHIEKKGDSSLVFLMADLEEDEVFKNYFCLHSTTNKSAGHLLLFMLSLVYIQNNPDEALIAQPSKVRLCKNEVPVPLSQFQQALIKPPIHFFM